MREDNQKKKILICSLIFNIIKHKKILETQDRKYTKN